MGVGGEMKNDGGEIPEPMEMSHTKQKGKSKKSRVGRR